MPSGGLAAILILFCASANCLGQSLQVVPPTPNAMKMTDYYAQQPGLYTGTAKVNIPLYTIDFDGWNLPLSLSYNATGIRTNEEATEVGLGWALNATGIISRTIRGGDDLFRGTVVGKGIGFIHDGTPITLDMGFDRFTERFPPSGSYYDHVARAVPDTEPDIFNYNFFGYSGSFTLSQKASSADGKSHVIKLTEDATSILFDDQAELFTVITPDGFKGEFTVKERSTSTTGKRETDNRQVACGEDYINHFFLINESGRLRTITSWYLSKITSPRSRQISFNYDTRDSLDYGLDMEGYSPYLSNERNFAEDGGQDQPLQCLQTIHEHIYLKSILSEDVGVRVDFSMEDREDLRKNELFLPSSLMVHLFPYSENLKRYTAITVTSLDTASTLNKSIVFTQNYFNQQYHQKYGSDENEVLWMRSRLDKVTIDDQEYRFLYYDGWKGLPNKETRGIDHFGYYNGNDDNTSLLYPPVGINDSYCSLIKDTVLYYHQSYDRIVNFDFGQAGLLKQVTYPTGGHTIFEYEPHTYLPDQSIPLREEPGLKQAGGARIRSIKEFDANDSLQRYRYYRYTKGGELDPLQTTGLLMTPLMNMGKAPIYLYGDPAYGKPELLNACNFFVESNSSIPGNNAAEGKIIGYSYVHEWVDGENGSYKNSYHFENRPNEYSTIPLASEGFPDLNGKISWSRLYDNSGKISQITSNEDQEHTLGVVNGLAYRNSNFQYIPIYRFYDIKRTFNTPFQIETTTASTPSGIVENTNGDIVTWGNSVRTQKNVAYDSSFLLKTEVVINSNGDTIRTEYKRPIDYTAPSLTLRHMVDSTVNIVQPVIEQIVSNNDTVISATGSRYQLQNGMVNLTASYSYNRDLGNFAPSSDGYVFPSPYELQTEYSLYDSQNGKLLEYKTRDGIANSFIWGYNGTLPIVHGEGISYNDLYQAHLDATSNPVPDYETAMRNHAKTTGKKISTYAHNPQVGISRLTDPAGLKKTFEYDTYGRLERVVDNDGKTLEQYTYHFRQPPPTRILSVSDDIDFGILTPDFFDEPLLEHYKKCSDGRTSRILTLSNTGEGDLAVYNLSLPANFTSSWAGGTISPGTSVDVIISFDNNDGNVAPGTYGGTISMSTNKTAGDSLASVTATYAARVCDVSFSTSVFNFGRTTGNILNQSLILTNNGNAPIRIIALPLDWNGTTGDYSSTHPDFRVETTIPPTLTTSPICVDAGASLSIPLSYVPTGTSATQTKLSVITDTGECGALADVVTIKGEKVPMGTPFLVTEASPIEMPPFDSAYTSRTITVTNLSMFPATVESVSSENSKFTISPSGGFVLDGFGEKTFTLTFAPNSGDFSPQSSIIHFNGNIAETTFSRTVTGQRTEVRTVSLSTNQIMINGHGAGTLTVTNNGNSNITLTGVKYEAPGGTYTSSPTWWSAGFTPLATPTLGPGQSTTMSIQSTSSYSEPQNIQVQYSKTGPLNANDVVQAVAINRNINVSAITFQDFYEPSITTNFVISNPDGNATLTVQNITSSNSKFTLSGSPALTFPFYLDPGQSRSVSVTYTSTDFSVETSNIVITSNATNVTGPITAVASALRIATRTLALSPGTVVANGYQWHYVTMSNTGNDNVTITGASYAFLNTSTYTSGSTNWTTSFSPGLPLTLGPGQSSSFGVMPVGSNPEDQKIRIEYNKTSGYTSSDEVQAFAEITRELNGVPTSYAFQSFTAASSSHAITVSNGGNSTLNISSISSTNSRFTASPSSVTLEPGTSQTVTVTYAPTDFSVQSGTMTFNSDRTSGNGTLSVTAQRAQYYKVTASPSSLVIKPSFQTQTSNVTNVGNVNATINSIGGNSNPSKFKVTLFQAGGWIPATLPYTLSPGQHLEVQVKSADGSFTSATGYLLVTPNQGSALVINLSRSPTP